MPGNFTIPNTFSTGNTASASEVNANFTAVLNNFTPTGLDDYSANLAQMQSTADPYPSSVESLATSGAGELERLRYIIKQITGEAQWYIDPDTSLATLRSYNQVVQVQHYQTGAVATGTTVIPNDDTIPQNTEGDQYMSLAITPTSATNTLLIEINITLAHSDTNGTFTVALFQDTTANALAATQEYSGGVAGAARAINFRHKMTTGTTSSTTFKVRAGVGVAGTTTFNGQLGARSLGGILASSITITEYLV